MKDTNLNERKEEIISLIREDNRLEAEKLLITFTTKQLETLFNVSKGVNKIDTVTKALQRAVFFTTLMK